MDERKEVVHVNVLGRDYPVKCTPKEGEELKGVEKDINRQLNQYRLKYVQLDKQDCLSMALIENLMDKWQSADGAIIDECHHKLDRLEALIAPHLST